MLLFSMFSGCATIIHGTKQSVSISSTPSNAVVMIDGQEKGNTPLLIDLSRKDHHTVKITLDGFLPYETRLVRKVDGWIAGNIVFGGLIGLAVDAISGGMYKLTPDQLQAEMRSGANASIDKSSGLYLTVVLNPQKNWQKIGQLERLN